MGRDTFDWWVTCHCKEGKESSFKETALRPEEDFVCLVKFRVCVQTSLTV